METRMMSKGLFKLKEVSHGIILRLQKGVSDLVISMICQPRCLELEGEVESAGNITYCFRCYSYRFTYLSFRTVSACRNIIHNLPLQPSSKNSTSISFPHHTQPPITTHKNFVERTKTKLRTVRKNPMASISIVLSGISNFIDCNFWH